MRNWFRIIPMSIACVASLVLFTIGVYDGQYHEAIACGLIALGSGMIVLSELVR